MRVIVAVVVYDTDAREFHEMSVAVSKTASAFLATLSDFELKVFATEAGIRVRKALELPPTPKP